MVDVTDDSGPVAGLRNADWLLYHRGENVPVVAEVDGYRGTYEATSVLFLIPATLNFAMDDGADSGEERGTPPLGYVLDGFETLKTGLNAGDYLAVGCHDENGGDAFALSGKRRVASRVVLPDVEAVIGRCRFGADDSRTTARIQTLYSSIIKSFVAGAPEGTNRHVVVIVTDGTSKEMIEGGWWRSLVADFEDGKWLELYVIGLEDGGSAGNIEKLGQGAFSRLARTRQELPAQMASFGDLVGGIGLYRVTYALKEPFADEDAEFQLAVVDGKSGESRSDPVGVGAVVPPIPWVRIGVAVLVGLLVLVVVVSLVLFYLAQRRRRLVELERAKQTQSGRAVLLVKSGPSGPGRFLLVNDVTVIGRLGTNDIAIADPYVGRRHCSITIRQKTFEIEDLKSNNGVLVNGFKSTRAYLSNGDLIRIGGTEIEFRLLNQVHTVV